MGGAPPMVVVRKLLRRSQRTARAWRSRDSVSPATSLLGKSCDRKIKATGARPGWIPSNGCGRGEDSTPFQIRLGCGVDEEVMRTLMGSFH